MFEWKEEYETGIMLIDHQHKMLFKIGIKAYELLKNNIYIDKYDRIINIIKELKEYTIYHFSEEEKYLKSILYKDFKLHKFEHDEFINKFNTIDLTHLDRFQDQYILSILEYVYKWIDIHILVNDKQYLKIQ